MKLNSITRNVRSSQCKRLNSILVELNPFCDRLLQNKPEKQWQKEADDDIEIKIRLNYLYQTDLYQTESEVRRNSIPFFDLKPNAPIRCSLFLDANHN